MNNEHMVENKPSNKGVACLLVVAMFVMTTLGGLLVIGSCSGCRTLSTTNQVDIATIAAAIKGVSQAATLYAVRKEPKSTNYLQSVALGLQTFSSQTNHDPASLLVFIDSLPIKNIQTPEAQLAIATIMTAYEIYWVRHPMPVDLRNKEFVKYIEALSQGINLGLGIRR